MVREGTGKRRAAGRRFCGWHDTANARATPLFRAAAHSIGCGRTLTKIELAPLLQQKIFSQSSDDAGDRSEALQ